MQKIISEQEKLLGAVRGIGKYPLTFDFSLKLFYFLTYYEKNVEDTTFNVNHIPNS